VAGNLLHNLTLPLAYIAPVMKYPASFIACLAICMVLLGYRSYYSEIGDSRKELFVTQWDAFGYYLYLPAAFIYHDYKKLDWADSADRKYHVTGGGGMPVQHLDNGNVVCKYLCGVAILQAPLFAIAHGISKACGYPADGFSPVYQHALAFGVIVYCILALFLLRNVLLRYFDDGIVAFTLLLLCLATNFIQYAAITNGLSHAWIFPLYVLLLYATLKWHERPNAGWALLTGYIIGLATICRPTEAIALFIPLLWNTHTKEAARAKWRAVKTHRLHVLYAALGGLIGIVPQLLYWKAVTGYFIYDVGSKWYFLDPWFRVLAGWEKGWFIYTPVTVFFVIGMFFMRKYPFRNAVLVFCLLNIWIVISWEDWRYGGSYSTRALMQSYPVFALSLAALAARVQAQRWRPVFYIAGAYLTGVNLFQTWQYNSTILHYNDMNRRYYSRIYLNPHPTPLDMSLLDTDEWLSDEDGYVQQPFIIMKHPLLLHFAANASADLADTFLAKTGAAGTQWLKIEAHIRAPQHLWKSALAAELRVKDSVKRTAIRLDNPVGERTGDYAFFMRVPAYFNGAQLKVSVGSAFDFDGVAERVIVTTFKQRKNH
jgi:hypothetical protein